MVLARKCRPKCLGEIIGQPVVVRTLTNALKNNHLHHAYLLAGNLGSGKTSVARILAASENCLVSPGLNPCGKCDLCKKVFEGKHTDILEINAASSAGKVEQVRQLSANALYSTVDGAKKKYFIIDECHSMSSESEESLLKLIEEPPSHVRFILCTTELAKMRATIQSRCQLHEFRGIYWREIADHLTRIAKAENISVEEDAIHLCARTADGSMRNALQNLDKLLDYSGDETATVKMAYEAFGTVSDKAIDDLLDQVIGVVTGKPDATEGYRIINNMLLTGADFSSIHEGLARHLGNIVVTLSASAAKDLVMVSDEGKRRLIVQAKACEKKLKGIMMCLKNLHESRTSVEYGLSPETALQMWFIESVYSIRQ